MNELKNNLVVVRGAGEMASGVIRKLHMAGFKVIALEKAEPSCIRRKVCFASAYYEKNITVENVTSILIDNPELIYECHKNNHIPLLIDEKALILKKLKPIALIDARMLKRENDTSIDMAPIVIGLGPGFETDKNCHAVVETNRGFDLGRAIYSGKAAEHTKIPGSVGNYTIERVLRSPCDGVFESKLDIGLSVTEGAIIGTVNNQNVIAFINGIIRGLIHNQSLVTKDQKIGDIDPRNNSEYCLKISDKANAIAGGVLEALMYFLNRC